MGLARSVNRLDFWNVADELTPAEMVAWQAEYQLEPWGEARADQRAAVNTSFLVLSQCTKQPDDSQINDMMRALQTYTPAQVAAEEQRFDSPAAAMALLDSLPTRKEGKP